MKKIKKYKVDKRTKDKMLIVIYDALNFRATKMLFPYMSEKGRKLIEVDFGKISKTFEWDK